MGVDEKTNIGMKEKSDTNVWQVARKSHTGIEKRIQIIHRINRKFRIRENLDFENISVIQ